jgi:DNA-binding PadR family transcriptional regulator
MRRGDVRSALLIALLDGPAHGYELIQLLETKTEGRWRPSPGSVYPSLQLLTDEGLVVPVDREGKRAYELTDEGRRVAEEHVASRGYPWDALDDGPSQQRADLRVAIRDLHLAVKQVAVTGTAETMERATGIVTAARKELYRLLADA